MVGDGQVSSTGSLQLPQAANVRLASKVFVEGDDFRGSKLERDFSNEVIRKSHSPL